MAISIVTVSIGIQTDRLGLSSVQYMAIVHGVLHMVSLGHDARQTFCEQMGVPEYLGIW
jgi:hypothetical protein